MVRHVWLLAILCICNVAFSQQLVLGNNPYLINKSAVLELNSDNQGLLLPRIADTSLINPLNPPDGMVIYFTSLKQIMVRSNGSWKAILSSANYLTSLTGDVTASGSGSATATIANNAVTYSKMQNVSANNRLLGRATTGSGTIEELTLGTGLSFSGTTLNVGSLPNSALNNSSISLSTGSTGTDINVSGSPVSLGGTVTLNIPSASSTARGLLTSTDWTTFNSKLSTTRNINTTSPLSGGGNLSADRTLSISQSNTTTDGYLSSADWNTFNNKISSTRTISTTAPLSGGGDLSANRTLSISQSNTTTDGYLSSIDWNTFNNKLSNSISTARLWGRSSAGTGSIQEITLGTGLSFSGTTLNVGSLPNSALTNSSISLSTGSTGTDINISGSPVSLGGTVTLNIPSASSTARGLLTNTDWTTFNNKLSSTRTINTTAPLSGGGDLSADRTLSISQANTTTNGYLSSTDWNTFNNKLSNSISTNKLWGRTTAGTGTIEEISVGTGLNLSGGSLSSNGWNITGNSGTNPSSNFIGTTDNQSLVVKTNNTERVRVDSIGNVGIGTNSPTAKFDLLGDMVLRTGSYTASNAAANHNIDIGKNTFIRITGPTANFTIDGIAGGVDGRVIILYNATSSSMTLANDNSNSNSSNRIFGVNNANVPVRQYGMMMLIYSSADSHWVTVAN